MKKIVALPFIFLLTSCSFFNGHNQNKTIKQQKEKIDLVFESKDEIDNSVLELYTVFDDELMLNNFRIRNDEQVLLNGNKYELDYDEDYFELRLYLNENELPVIATYADEEISILLEQEYVTPIYKIDPLLDERTKILEIDTSSVKKVYEKDEIFDPSNLVVKRHLNSGEVIECSEDEYEIDEVDTSSPGYKYINIRYLDFYASFRIIVKGYVARNYDEKYIYFLGETFDRNYFSLTKYDEYGEHQIDDYIVNFPNNEEIGLGDISIVHDDQVVYSQTVAILKKQDNVPVIFSSTGTSALYLFANNIHNEIYQGHSCTVSEGNYLLVKEDQSLEIFDYRYMLYTPLNASYFGCNDSRVIQRLIPGGILLVTIDAEHFYIEPSIWHHCLIGW